MNLSFPRNTLMEQWYTLDETILKNIS
jgi:hypothetical protein